MTQVTAAQVKDLRDRTGLGMMECKKALRETNGDIDLAIENLRKNSGLKAAKKAGRVAAEGVVVSRTDADNAKGMLIEVNSETDFVARDEGFLAFANSVADAAFTKDSDDVSELMTGDLEASREALVQKIGENVSVRRMVRTSGDVVGSYVHNNNRIAVLVTLKGGNAELAKDVAMHVAAVNPTYVSPEHVPEEAVNAEKEILIAQAQDTGKPLEIIEKMIGGRLKKFLAEVSLTEQAFVKNPDVTVGQLVKEAGAELVAFMRYEVGEGIEKAEEDFAAEVAAQLAGK